MENLYTLNNPINEQQWLVENYFSNPDKCRSVPKGEFLIQQGEENDRLYMVLSGSFTGYAILPDGTRTETFKSKPQMFVGVSSFFSKTYISSVNVEALEDSKVAYIDQYQKGIHNGSTDSIVEQFMPVIVLELINRQKRIFRIAHEKEKALKTLIHTEKMVSLGQIAAGIAHELNNAVAVIQRQGEWLKGYLSNLIGQACTDRKPFFDHGQQSGRTLSTREIRLRSKHLQKKFKLNERAAHQLAETGLSDAELEAVGSNLSTQAQDITHIWEIGATLHDLLLAADHANHVVRSIKNLGAQQSERKPGLTLNLCVEEAVTLLSSHLRTVRLETDLCEHPPIIGNKGELVQVLINLIKNACEALRMAKTDDPYIYLSSHIYKDELRIHVRDNGPGIPRHLQPRIFEPQLTSKTDGQTVGLGLGLTIVQQLINSYGGAVAVESKPGQTEFTLRIPLGEPS